jgi:hypothetical protein
MVKPWQIKHYNYDVEITVKDVLRQHIDFTSDVKTLVMLVEVQFVSNSGFNFLLFCNSE